MNQLGFFIWWKDYWNHYCDRVSPNTNCWTLRDFVSNPPIPNPNSLNCAQKFKMNESVNNEENQGKNKDSDYRKH